MRRLPSLRALLFSLVFLTLPVFVFPLRASACQAPGPPRFPRGATSTTHFEGISPQVALPGVTRVYIQGYCFGDTQGTGRVTVNGEAVTIVFWTDAEIEFILPFDATTGDLVVTSSSYGSDSSATEADCSSPFPASVYCGNDKINATFVIATVNAPVYWLQPLGGTQSAPQYAEGTWYYDNGGETMTLTLTQGPQNSNGTWPITGTEESNVCPGQLALSGVLDQYGDLSLYLPCESENFNCIEWLVLASGDVTSQGLAFASCPPNPPLVGFLQSSMDNFEGPYNDYVHPPLFKSQTDKPPSESPVPQGWWTGPGSTLRTYGLWARVLPPVNSFIGFAGRFVYEQSGGSATDGCFFTNSKHAGVTTTVTGGGWFVDQSGDWGPDEIGASSQFDSYYQGYYGPMGITCEVTGPQELHTDGRTGPIKYITDTQMPAEITPTELLTGVAPGGGQMVTECENYPSLKGKCR